LRQHITSPIAAVIATTLLFAVACTGSEPPREAAATGVDPKADRLLHATSDLLGSSKSFTFTATEVRDRIRRSGQKEQVQLTKTVSLRRPDRMHLKIVGPNRTGAAFYDGRTVSLVEEEKKMYAQANVPATIDEPLDLLAVRFDVPMPMADLMYSNMYELVMTPHTRGQYIGEVSINGTTCHHLSSQQTLLDWQVWIAAGDRPLPCQLETLYKNDDGQPVTRITFSDWNMDAQLDDTTFAFTPPADYERIRIVGRSKSEEKTEESSNDAK